MISQWDEAETGRSELGHLSALWSDLSGATGATRLGVARIQIRPLNVVHRAHIETAEEEIFYVLDGTGTLESTPSPTLVDQGREPESQEVRAGTFVSRQAGKRVSHVSRAGTEGSRCSRTASAAPTTSSTTRARTRSTSAASA